MYCVYGARLAQDIACGAMVRNALALLLALAPLADDMHTGQYPQKALKLKWNKMRVKWIKNESKVVKR